MKQGTRVRCIPSKDEAETELTPPGRWWVVSASPTSGRYWLSPDDDAARSWASGTGQKFLERHKLHMAVSGRSEQA